MLRFNLLILLIVGCSNDKDGDGFTSITGDCDDENSEINPMAIEICDGLDNNCNEEIDELGAQGGYIWYGDGDRDGHGTETIQLESCQQPEGYSGPKDDCDDSNPNTHPDAVEVCDGEDNDCDTLVDEYTAADATVWYPDLDGDGFGNGDVEILGCDAPPDHVLVGGDCDDIDPSIHPEAIESCETPYDDDCNGVENQVDAYDCTNFYADIDGDSFAGDALCLCEANGTHTLTVGLDCDETNPDINPDAHEVSDFADNDCDGTGSLFLRMLICLIGGRHTKRVDRWVVGILMAMGLLIWYLVRPMIRAHRIPQGPC